MKINAVVPFLGLALLITVWSCHTRSGEERPSSHTPGQIDTTSDLFDADVEVYENPDRVIWQKPDLVIQQLGNVEGKVIADIGAGTGYFSRRIAYKGAKVIAIDIDPQAIQWMEEQKARFPPELQDRLIIRHAVAHDPMLAPNEVDMVLLVNTYSYIQDRIPYFTRLKDALRSGGQMVIIDFKKISTPFGPPVEERVDVDEVVQELEEAGYSVRNVDEASLEYQYIIKVRKE